MKIPEKGASRQEVLARLEELRANDANWREGKTWSLVYYAGDDLLGLLKDAYTAFFSENGLSPIAFPSLKNMENEAVSLTATLLNGDEAVAGSMTSGGTESILMAVKAAREWGRFHKPYVQEPEMVLPISAHPAFEKAAHYFDVKAIHIPVDGDCRADVNAARKAVTTNTVLMVGSAPSFPQGVVDPIAELAAVAQEAGVLFHTDACLGGFLLPWLERLGYAIPLWDFRVPGVTSISADLHKYGFAAKGASFVLYRNAELRRHQFFTYTGWPGGLYGSPTATGTRPGGAIAAAWAVMQYLGEEGYLDIARRIMDVTKRIQEGISAIPSLKILGKPDASIFAIGSDELNPHALGDAMERRGWRLDYLQNPDALHVMVTPAHEAIVEPFLAALAEAVEEVKATAGEGISGTAAIYGMVGTLPDKSMASEFILDFLDQIFQRE